MMIKTAARMKKMLMMSHAGRGGADWLTAQRSLGNLLRIAEEAPALQTHKLHRIEKQNNVLQCFVVDYLMHRQSSNSVVVHVEGPMQWEPTGQTALCSYFMMYKMRVHA